MPVNKKRCATCPFNDDGDKRIRGRVEIQVRTTASQICHHTDKTRCKGARDFQLQTFHRLDLIEEPTEAAWNKELIKLGIEP